MFARRMINYPSMAWRNPLIEMERMTHQMDLLTRAMLARPGMQWFFSKVFPSVNITEDKEKYYVQAELPGIKSDEIDLRVNGKTLTISGERKIESEGDSARYHCRERDAGKFSRAIELPGVIDADSVDAKMVNGVLMVELSKSEAAKPKQITVH